MNTPAPEQASTELVTVDLHSKELPTFEKEAGSLVKWATSLIIANAEGFNSASEQLKIIKDWKNKVENDKESLYRPIKTALDTVSARFKPPLDQLTEAEKVLRGKMTTYDMAEKEKQRKAEEEERKRREDEALRLAKEREDALAAEKEALAQQGATTAAELRAAGDEDMAAAVEAQTAAGLTAMESAHEEATEAHFTSASTVQEIAKTTHLVGGAFTTRKVKKHRLLDITKVPAAYLLLNDAAVREAMRNGVTAIPGVEFYEEGIGSMRSAA